MSRALVPKGLDLDLVSARMRHRRWVLGWIALVFLVVAGPALALPAHVTALTGVTHVQGLPLGQAGLAAAAGIAALLVLLVGIGPGREFAIRKRAARLKAKRQRRRSSTPQQASEARDDQERGGDGRTGSLTTLTARR